MAIAPMKHLELYGLLPHKRVFLRELQKLGLVEITDISTEQAERFEKESLEQIGAIEKDLNRLSRVLAVLNRFDPQKPNLVEQFTGIRTVLTEQEREELLSRSDELVSIVESILQDESTYNRLEQENAETKRGLAELAPWEGLQLSVEEIAALKRVKILTGTVEGKIDPLVEILEQAGVPYVLEVIGRLADRYYLALYLPASALAAASLKTAGFTESAPPIARGTVAKGKKQLEARLEGLEKELAEVRERLHSYSQHRRLIQVFYDQMYNAKLRAEVERHIIGGSRVFALEGWVEAAREPIVAEALKKLKLPHELILREPNEEEEVPVVLHNTKAITPFESLIESFSLPRQQEVDPTPSVAPFFFIFFGMALGDAGYGLVMAAICFWLLRKTVMRPSGKKLAWMFIFSSLGAVLFGFIVSSFFGYSPYKGLFSPTGDSMLLLGLAFGLGLIQLYVGTMISGWMSIRDGRWQDAFWNQGLWLLFLTAILLVLGKSALGLEAYSHMINTGALIITALLVLGNMRGKKGLAAKLLAIPGGLFTIYGSIGFFSDVLSYARLMALGLSGGVMASVINMFVGMAWQVPWVGWLIAVALFLVGHGLNFGLSILGAYVHCSRLQFLEFFGKFFEGGGKPFTPLQWENQYIFRAEEREA